MARISFTAHLEKYVPCPPGEVNGATVREALETVFASNPQLQGYIVDDHFALRRHMVIFIDGRIIADRKNLSDPITPASDIYVLQALSGG
jgi:molybdopterin synthase sulfur carrier subunit